MASFLIDTAKGGIDALDPGSSCAKELKEIDIDNILKEDISRICETISFIEITKILSLSTRLQAVSQAEEDEIKRKIKKMSQVVVARVEAKSGKLMIPESCRHMLLNL
ncbi:MAG: hypothetical protein V3S49_06200 [Thermodesulfobacteriota bacterium]